MSIWEPYTLAGNEKLLGHGHDSLHLIRIVRGGFVERVGERWAECGEGTIRVSSPNTLHDIQTNGEGCELFIVELPSQASHRMAETSVGSNFVHSAIISDVDEKLHQAIYTENEFEIESRSLEISARLSAHRYDSPPSWLQTFRNELAGIELQKYSLAKLSQKFGRHRSHVARAFHDHFGQTPGSLVRAARLAVAKLRLKSSDEPIVTLAYELGFSDQAHFSNAFRNRYGCSPSAFRQKMKGDEMNATLVQANSRESHDHNQNMHATTKGIHVHH